MKWKVALVVTLALIASACRAGSKSATPSSSAAASTPVTSASAAVTGAVGSATSSASGSGAQLETTLAAVGIATVADETTTTPTVTVTGPPVLTLTAWQVANLDAEAAGHGGMTGVDLDTMLPMPPTAPTFADIIGGWVIAAGDPTATAAGVLLDKPDWTHPDQVVFPTAVLTLFEADLLQHVSAASPAASPAASAVASGAAWRGNATKIEEVSLVTAPCSEVSNFVDSVLNQVFGLLKVNPTDVSNFVNGVVGGGVLGSIAGGVAGFLAGFWNHAVDLAEQAVKDVIKGLTQDVLSAMALVIGGVEVITMIRSYLQQWTAAVVANPAGNTFPVRPSVNKGNVAVSIDTKAEIQDWPPQMVDCAKAAGVELPTLAKAGAPVTWTAVGQEPGLITPSALTGTLDTDLTQTLTYVTGNEDAKTHAKGTLVSPTVTADVRVRRTEVEQLRIFVTAYVTGKVPTLVAPVLNPILASAIELATKFLDTITAVTGTTTFVVSHHVPKPPSPSPTPSSTPSSSSPPAPQPNGAKCTDLTNAAASAVIGRATTVALDTSVAPLAGLTVCTVTVANGIYPIQLSVNTSGGAAEFAADRSASSNVADLGGVGDKAFTSSTGVEALRGTVDITVFGPAGPVLDGNYTIPTGLAKAMVAAVK